MGGGGGGEGSLSPPRLNIFTNGQYGISDLPLPRRSALSEVLLVQNVINGLQ